VPYAALVTAFEKIEKTTKRLEILEILTQFLLAVAKRDTATDAKNSNLLKVVYLCINRVSSLIHLPTVDLIKQLCPDYMGIELGIGEMLLVKAIAESTGRATTKIKEDLRKEGDLGKVAMVSCNSGPYSQTELEKQPTNHVQAKSLNGTISFPKSNRNRKGFR